MEDDFLMTKNSGDSSMNNDYHIVTKCDNCWRDIHSDEVYYECRIGGLTPVLCNRCVRTQKNGLPFNHGDLIDSEVEVQNYITTWECQCSEYGEQTVMAVDDLRYLPVALEEEK